MMDPIEKDKVSDEGAKTLGNAVASSNILTVLTSASSVGSACWND